MTIIQTLRILALPLVLVGCVTTSGGDGSGTGGEGGTESGGSGGEGASCPSTEDPAVHYLETDPALCGMSDCGGSDCIPCRGDQEYFENECGCGCIDTAPVCPSPEDPAVHYLQTDPALCGTSDCGGADCIPCRADQEYFENECGCGCIDTAPVCPDPADPSVHYLETDPALCGMTDCGEADCIPCDAAQTYFENECGCGCIDPS